MSLNSKFSRRRFLQASAGTAATVALGGLSTASRVMAQDAPTGVLNWMTWEDHSYPEQLAEVKEAIGIEPNITLFADNAEAYTKILEVGGQIDLVSGDGGWVPKFFDDGLTEAFDINSIDAAQHLYPFIREFPLWQRPEGYLGYPFGWSPVQIYYNPAKVSPAPDSWEVLLDPKYQGRVAVENQPVEVTAYMGKYTGAADVYNMTDDELAAAKAAMEVLKPNVLRLTEQQVETWDLLVNEEVWIATGNLGTDLRVPELGGPNLVGFTPKEGTVGWMDAEMIVKDGQNNNLVLPFLNAAEQPEYIAQNFLDRGRPLFNETAYKLLVDAGHQERADAFLFNKPETVLTMTIKGPGGSTEGAINAFNEVFGA